MTFPADTERQHWMGLLARAATADLEAWGQTAGVPEYAWLRKPETGLVMVRARAGGTGERFNLGEMTVTRCALRVAGGESGVAYVAGRSHRHAELAAVADALLQGDARAAVERTLLAALARAEAERRGAMRRKAEATRVEFFTLVRGDG